MQPLLILLIRGHYIRIHQEPSFQLRKAMWVWTYNALLNVSIMDSLFHYNLPHKRQIEEWRRWD